MVEIKRFGVMSVAKISGIITLIAGLIIGIPMALLMMAGLMAVPGGAGMGGSIFAVVLIFIFMVVFYAILGFLWGAVAAFVYNLAAGWFGGIEFETDATSDERF